MLILIILLFLGNQDKPYSGTYSSDLQTLYFIDDHNCTLTTPTAWHGSKKQKFRFIIKDEGTIELKKYGFTRYTFKLLKTDSSTFLVRPENFDKLKHSLMILNQGYYEKINPITKEELLVTNEIVNSTLKQNPRK